MWQDKLKEIIYILENSNVNEIEVAFWGKKFRVAKAPNVLQSSEGSNTITTNDTKPPIDKNTVEQSKTVSTEKSDEKLEEILSPMPGTFYSAPTPEDPPFIKMGDSVKKGQILCIIEAMKIMNEIESDFDGKIVAINIENDQPVEYNQILFKIEPA